MFGASDDLIELRGALNDEAGAGEVSEHFIVDGRLEEEPGCDCKYAQAASEHAKAHGKRITALWCAEKGYGWTYKTDIPHSTFFEIVEDGEPYCRGIVFKLKDCA